MYENQNKKNRATELKATQFSIGEKRENETNEYFVDYFLTL